MQTHLDFKIFLYMGALVALYSFPGIVLVTPKTVPALILDRLFLFGCGELLSKAAEIIFVLSWDIFNLLYC